MLELVESENAGVSLEEIAVLVGATEIEGIFLHSVDVTPVHAIPASITVTSTRIKPEFGITEDNRLLVKFDHEVICQDSDDLEGEPATTIRTTHMLVLGVNAPVKATPAALLAFADTNAYFIVYPYFRQFLTSLTSDLGFPPVVLGYIRRDDFEFQQLEDGVEG